MKIYIETDMKQMPKGCKDCTLAIKEVEDEE